MTVVSHPPHTTEQPATDGPGPAAPPLDVARLVRDHQAEVWRYLRYLGAQSAEADDLTQEAFLAIARASFREQSPAQTRVYLRTVARRQLLMLRRKQQSRGVEVDVDAAETVWSETYDEPRFDDQVEAARGCVEKLEGRARRAIDAAYQDDKSREAIAAALDMTADGVKTLLRRTRAKLRECIERKLAQANPK